MSVQFMDLVSLQGKQGWLFLVMSQGGGVDTGDGDPEFDLLNLNCTDPYVPGSTHKARLSEIVIEASLGRAAWPLARELSQLHSIQDNHQEGAKRALENLKFHNEGIIESRMQIMETVSLIAGISGLESVAPHHEKEEDSEERSSEQDGDSESTQQGGEESEDDSGGAVCP